MKKRIYVLIDRQSDVKRNARYRVRVRIDSSHIDRDEVTARYFYTKKDAIAEAERLKKLFRNMDKLNLLHAEFTQV